MLISSITATNRKPNLLLLLCLTVYVFASVIGCNPSSESREEEMLPNSSRFVPVGPAPPASPPEVYLVDENRVPLIRAKIFTGDWTGMGGGEVRGHTGGATLAGTAI